MNGALTRGEKVFLVINNIVMVLLCAAMLYPVLFVVGRSVTPEIERALHPLRLIPSTFDWSGYKFILSSGSNIINSYMTTIMRTLIGTTLNIAVTTLLAYPLSKQYYPPRKALTAIIVFTMWFSGGLIPSFLLNKSLGLLNNFWVYILPSMVNAFNLIVMRNFFSQIPDSLEESAKLDGANKLQQIIHITIPALSEIIAIMLILQIGKMFDDNFDQIFNLYSPSVYEVSDVFETYVYRNGIQQSKFSYSAAVGLVKSVLALAMIVFSNKASKKLGAQGLF